MKKLGLCFIALLLISPPRPAQAAPAEFETNNTYSNRILTREDLDPVALRENALDTLLNERLQRVISSTGIAPDDFQTSVSVTVIETIPKPPAKPNKPENKGTPVKDEPPFESFSDSSLFSADHLLKKFRNDQKVEDAEGADRQDEEEEKPVPEKDYTVTHVYMHVAVGDKVQKEVADQIEKVVQNAFSPNFGKRFSFDVQKGIHIFPSFMGWAKIALDWLTKLQWLVLALLASIMAVVLLWSAKLIPSWQKYWIKRSAHDYNYNKSNRSQEEYKEEVPESEEEAAPEEEQIPEAEPIMAEALPDSSAIEAQLIKKQILRLKKNILAFCTQNSYVVERVLQDWANNGDNETTYLKINLALEFLVSQHIQIGKVELRQDVLRELKKTKKRALELAGKEKLELFDSIYWDFISFQHLAQEQKPKALQFLDVVDDRVMIQIMRKEEPRVKAMILISIDEKRAAQILSMLPIKERKQVLFYLFGAEADLEKQSVHELRALTTRLQASLETALEENATMGVRNGVEDFIPILKSMDFETQFAAAKGFLGLPPAAKNKTFSVYFNVGLLPDVKTEFLETVFLDRPSTWIINTCSVFDSELLDRVKDVLPPLQRRMLEGADLSSVPRGEAMTLLAELNREINQKIAAGSLVCTDIFDLETEQESNGSSQAA